MNLNNTYNYNIGSYIQGADGSINYSYLREYSIAGLDTGYPAKQTEETGHTPWRRDQEVQVSLGNAQTAIVDKSHTEVMCSNLKLQPVQSHVIMIWLKHERWVSSE